MTNHQQSSEVTLSGAITGDIGIDTSHGLSCAGETYMEAFSAWITGVDTICILNCVGRKSKETLSGWLTGDNGMDTSCGQIGNVTQRK